MKHISISLAIVFIVLLLGFWGWSQRGDRQPSPQPVPRSNGAAPSLGQVPDFTLESFDGQVITAQQLAGQPLVINSWAAWCPFCVRELRDFAIVQQEFSGRLTIVAIDRAETLSVAKKFTDQLGVTEDLLFLLDPTDSFYQAMGGFSMPETLFVDSEGTIRFHKRGPMEADEIRQRVRELL